jgi:hypothetical protein
MGDESNLCRKRAWSRLRRFARNDGGKRQNLSLKLNQGLLPTLRIGRPGLTKE